MNFTHQVGIASFAGDAYSRGKQLGEYVKSLRGRYIDSQLSVMKDSWLYSALGMCFDLSPEFVTKGASTIEALVRSVHPSLIDEIYGFADGLEEEFHKTLVFVGAYGGGAGCSHFYANGFHGHNYDDSPRNADNQFLLVQGTDIYASFGASDGYIGRLDGMNEKGVAVSLSFGAGNTSAKPGVGAILLERIILDKAATTKEALELFDAVGYVSPNNLLISDRTGKAVVIEMSGGKHRIREVTEGVLYCANSYLHPQMKSEQTYANPTTKWREAKLRETLHPQVSRDNLKRLLASDFPEGLYEPYFRDELGTLWSVLFSLKSLDVDLAVGETTSKSGWLSFNLIKQMSDFTLPKTLKVSMKDMAIEDRITEYNLESS